MAFKGLLNGSIPYYLPAGESMQVSIFYEDGDHGAQWIMAEPIPSHTPGVNPYLNSGTFAVEVDGGPSPLFRYYATIKNPGRSTSFSLSGGGNA